MADGENEGSTKSDVIIEAADRLFTRFGFRRTSMDDIAREAGVAKGTLYLYFVSKEALFRALLARNVGLAEQLCDAALARGGDLATQIFGQLDAWFGMVLDRYGASGHLSELSVARLSVGKEIVDVADRAYEARLVRMVETAQAEGTADLTSTGLDARQIVLVLLAAARGAKYEHGTAVTPEAFRTSLLHVASVLSAAISVS